METYATVAPIIQQQELTWRCNNLCPFCYNPERAFEAFVPRQCDRERNLAVAEESVRRGVMAVCPTGGEPLLVGEHLFEILAAYHQAGCYTSINSNGRLLTAQHAQRLADLGLNSALISIHGLSDLHDAMVGTVNAFPETWRGLLLLRDHGIAVMPNFVATAKNVHGLLAVGKALSEQHIDAMTVTPFLPSWGSHMHQQFVLLTEHYRTYFAAVRSIRQLGVRIDSTLPIPPCVLIRHFPDDWPEFLAVLSPRVCMAGRSFGVVSPDAQFRACIQAPYLADFGGSVIDSYAASWNRANRWADPELFPEACRTCAALDVCGGGCRTSCLWENHGSVQGSTMYMGQPLTVDQAAPFLARAVWSEIAPTERHFHVHPQVKVRNEGWGTIVFTPKYQSFTILSPEAGAAIRPESTIEIGTPKVAAVLQAIHAIQPVDQSLPHAHLPRGTTVLPGSLLLPRLAQHFTDHKRVYYLRADTGERYFF